MTAWKQFSKVGLLKDYSLNHQLKKNSTTNVHSLLQPALHVIHTKATVDFTTGNNCTDIYWVSNLVSFLFVYEFTMLKLKI